MELTIELSGTGSLSETADLQEWLRDAHIREVERLTLEEAPAKQGEQGPTLLAILTVVLGARATVELVRSIHRYIDARKPKTKIKIKLGKKTVEIDCTNPPPLPELVEQAKVLMAE
jgi:hypothetical protein